MPPIGAVRVPSLGTPLVLPLSGLLLNLMNGLAPSVAGHAGHTGEAHMAPLACGVGHTLDGACLVSGVSL